MSSFFLALRKANLEISLPACACLIALTTGCSISSTGASSSESNNVAVSRLSGTVHGGQQPISGATIKLYVAGSTGYGSAATYTTGDNLLGSNVVTTSDGTGEANSNANSGNANNTMPKGHFIIDNDYNCPSPTSLVYIVATGGDPGVGGSADNTAIKLVTALGPCGNLNTTTIIAMNELTTVAAAYALGQFFTPTFGATSADTIGAPTSNQIGLTNAFATAVNLVNTTTGSATGTSAASGTNFYLASNDALKLATIGNILADCVNSSSATSTACASLFGAVTPTYAPLTTSTPATVASDIFQTAVYMLLNPTSTNTSSSATNMTALMGLQTAYMQWSPALSAAPTDWTLAIQYSGTGITYNSSAAVDENGDIWLSNANTPGGVVLINGGTGTAGGTPGITGGVIGFYSTMGTVTANQTRQVAIDQNGKAWFGGFAPNTADSKYYMFRAAGGSGIEGTFALPTGSQQPYAVAVDPGNLVFATTTSTNLMTTSATATSGTIMTNKTLLEGSSSTTIAIDSNKVAYVPSGSSNSVYEFTSNNSTAVAGSPFASSSLSTPYGAAIDGQNRLWMANSGASSIAYLSGSGASGSFVGITNTCLQSPKFIAIDGNNNVWVSNGNGLSGNTNYTICEFNSNGTLISNSTGFGLHGIAAGRGIAIDMSGNVWVTSYATTSFNVTQIVGAAVPVVNPITTAIKNSTMGTRP